MSTGNRIAAPADGVIGANVAAALAEDIGPGDATASLLDDVPDSATFGLHVFGNSMEPTLEDGQAIWVQMQPTLEDGEIGVFYLDGNAFVKEYRRTDKGVFLISHNEKYKPIPITDYDESRIYGKVVYPR